MKKNETTETITRRDALKLGALASAAALTAGATPAKAELGQKMNLKRGRSVTDPLRIVIIGGGMAGTAMAFRLSRAITFPKITLFDPEPKSTWYQPGMTLVGAGIWRQYDLEYRRGDYIPNHTEIVDSAIVGIDRKKRVVTDDRGKKTPYDYLIVASGARLDFGAVKGLEGSFGSLESLENRPAWMDDDAVGSVYHIHGANRLSEQFDTLASRASGAKEPLRIWFTQPAGNAFKAPAAGLSMLMVLLDRLGGAKCEITVASEDGRLSASDTYDTMLKKRLEKAGVKVVKGKLATIDRTARKLTLIDERGDETHDYDFIHITPPMRADAIYEEAGLTGETGWLDVNPKTLLHRDDERIFAVGDAAGTGALKTAMGISDQVKTVVDAMRAIDEGKKPSKSYDGYGCDTFLCPGGRKALFVSYGFDKKPVCPLDILFDAKRCSKINWYAQLHWFRPYLMSGVLKGWV